MVNRLYERLDKIKREKRETRWDELKKICIDNDIINDALDIAKHESSIYLPGVALTTAVAALILSFSNSSLILSLLTIHSAPILFVFISGLSFVIIILYFYFKPWMEVYYDLIELRMMRREETRQTVSSKLDEITLPSNGDPYKSHKNPDGYLDNRYGNNNRRDRKPEKCLEKDI